MIIQILFVFLLIDLTDDTKHINYSREAAKCYKKKTLAPYIMEEIEKISWADLLFFQFPLYWYSLPAILKGWIDKVLIEGFAYDFNCGAVLENGLLKVHQKSFCFLNHSIKIIFFIPLWLRIFSNLIPVFLPFSTSDVSLHDHQ